MEAYCILRNFEPVVLRQVLLFPFAVLYGLVMRVRNAMFNSGILRETKHPVPVISVGNLVAGGTGKTPHVEYLVRLLGDEYKLATLSRGYGRNTKGFRLASADDDYTTVGDEPLQYKRKFRDLIVSVDESRNDGVRKLLDGEEPPDVILLDDAFQHRWIKPGLNILLTDFHSLYVNDYMLPSGYLREPVRGAKRADIIIITKTPSVLSPITRRRLQSEIKPCLHQKLFFSYISYENLVPLTGAAKDITPSKVNAAFLFAGIANPYPLEDHLRRKFGEVITMEYPDHHNYDEDDIKDIIKVFNDHIIRKKILITTEKDAVRLLNAKLLSLFSEIPLAYIPIRIDFHNGDGRVFDQQIRDYVEQDRRKP